MARDILKQVRIAAPCTQSWHSMTGDDRVRFCAECKLNVYNISEMNSKEARALLEAHEGKRLCGRIYQRRDGTLITRNCPPALVAMRKRLAYAVAVIGALAFSSFSIAKSKINAAEDQEDYSPALVDRARAWPVVGTVIERISPSQLRMLTGVVSMPTPTRGGGTGAAP